MDTLPPLLRLDDLRAPAGSEWIEFTPFVITLELQGFLSRRDAVGALAQLAVSCRLSRTISAHIMDYKRLIKHYTKCFNWKLGILNESLTLSQEAKRSLAEVVEGLRETVSLLSEALDITKAILKPFGEEALERDRVTFREFMERHYKGPICTQSLTTALEDVASYPIIPWTGVIQLSTRCCGDRIKIQGELNERLTEWVVWAQGRNKYPTAPLPDLLPRTLDVSDWRHFKPFDIDDAVRLVRYLAKDGTIYHYMAAYHTQWLIVKSLRTFQDNCGIVTELLRSRQEQVEIPLSLSLRTMLVVSDLVNTKMTLVAKERLKGLGVVFRSRVKKACVELEIRPASFVTAMENITKQPLAEWQGLLYLDEDFTENFRLALEHSLKSYIRPWINLMIARQAYELCCLAAEQVFDLMAQASRDAKALSDSDTEYETHRVIQ